MSEGNIVLRVLNESSAELGNIFWELVTEAVVTQTTVIFEGALSIEIIVLPVSEMEDKYSGTLLRLKA